MKRIAILISCLCLFSLVYAQKVKTGIEMLKATNFKVLEGKRVGLVTNPTGVDNNLVSDIDILHNAPNVKLVAGQQRLAHGAARLFPLWQDAHTNG